MNEEIKIKEKRILNLMNTKNLSGLLLTSQTNFLWFTGGKRNDVARNDDISLIHLLITKDKRYLIASSSDLNRVMEEEFLSFGFESVLYRWYSESVFNVVKKIIPKGRIGADFIAGNLEYMEEDITLLRIDLTDYEVKRAKILCKEYSNLLTDFCFNLKPGLTEKEIAIELEYICQKHNIRFPVLMVGSDERIFKYRHPVATDKKIQKYVLLATVAERDGLNVSISRSIYFGKAPRDLAKRHEAVNHIECYYYYHSNPGVNLKDLFELGKKAYIETGFNDEWKNHIQGGPIGYKPREVFATSSSDLELKANYLMGWNPTIAGVKAEDIILVKENGAEQLSIDKRWPYSEISIYNKKYLKPKILEI